MLRQGATTYRTSFFTDGHYRQSSEGLPSGPLPSPILLLPFLKSFLKADLGIGQTDGTAPD